MIAGHPIANLLVIRSRDIERAVTFYQQMGMQFVRHAHGHGPDHFSSDLSGFIFEIYPQRNASDFTFYTRIGFSVVDLDGTIKHLREIGASIVCEPTDREWGRCAVLKDFDGHTVELLAGSERSPQPMRNG